MKSFIIGWREGEGREIQSESFIFLEFLYIPLQYILFESGGGKRSKKIRFFPPPIFFTTPKSSGTNSASNKCFFCTLAFKLKKKISPQWGEVWFFFLFPPTSTFVHLEEHRLSCCNDDDDDNNHVGIPGPRCQTPKTRPNNQLCIIHTPEVTREREGEDGQMDEWMDGNKKTS